MSQQPTDARASRQDAGATTRWRAWGAAALVTGMSLLQAACGGGSEANSPGATATQTRMRALAVGDVLPSADGVYAVRNVAQPTRVLATSGLAFTTPVTTLDVPAGTTIPPAATIEFTAWTASSGVSGGTAGCGFLSPRMLGLSGRARNAMQVEGAQPVWALWQFSKVLVCAKASPLGRGVMLRWPSVPGKVLRLVGDRLEVAAEAQTPEFIASATFELEPVAAFLGNQAPDLQPPTFPGAVLVNQPVTAGLMARDLDGGLTRVELLDVSDGVGKVIATGTYDQDISVYRHYGFSWSPRAAVHSVALRMRAWDNRGAWTDTDISTLQVVATAAPADLRVSVAVDTPGPLTTGYVKVFAKAEDLRNTQLVPKTALRLGDALVNEGLFWLEPGTHVFTAQATDAFGQVTVRSAPLTLVVAPRAPGSDAVQLGGVPVGGVLAPSKVPLLTVNATGALRDAAVFFLADDTFGVPNASAGMTGSSGVIGDTSQIGYPYLAAGSRPEATTAVALAPRNTEVLTDWTQVIGPGKNPRLATNAARMVTGSLYAEANVKNWLAGPPYPSVRSTPVRITYGPFPLSATLSYEASSLLWQPFTSSLPVFVKGSPARFKFDARNVYGPARYEVVVDGQVVASAAAPIVTWTPARGGFQQILGRVTDSDGAVALTPATPVFVQVDGNKPPTVGLAGVRNGQILTPGTAVALATNPGDSDGWITRVDFYDGSTLIGSRTSRPWTLNWVATPGVHVLSAQAFDNQGASSDRLVAIDGVRRTAAATVSVKPAGSNLAPKVRIVSPLVQKRFADDPNVLEARPGDADGWIVRVEFHVDGVLKGTATKATGWKIDVGLPVGSYSVSAKAFDNEGQSGTSAPVTLHLVVPN